MSNPINATGSVAEFNWYTTRPKQTDVTGSVATNQTDVTGSVAKVDKVDDPEAKGKVFDFAPKSQTTVADAVLNGGMSAGNVDIAA